MKIAVTEFKAHCTEILRTLKKPIEITNRGEVVAIITPPPASRENPIVGCLQGTVTYGSDWDQPLDEGDWEACQ